LKATNRAISQIKNRNSHLAHDEYQDNLLLVGISYDKASKIHECVIEKLRMKSANKAK